MLSQRTLFFERYAKAICAVCGLAAPILFLASIASHRTNANNVTDWLPKKFEATQRLAWYVERFGSDEILAVSWSGCTLTDPRLPAFAELMQLPQTASDGSKKLLFKRIFTGHSVATQLSQAPLQLDENTIAKRLRGWLVGEDGQTTCAIALAKPLEDGRRDRHAAVAAARRRAAELGIPADDLKIAGPTADAVAIDEAGGPRILLLAGVCAIWGGILTLLCLRNVIQTSIVLSTALFCWAASVSVVYFSGDHMDAVLLTMPALIFVLAISGAIHLTHYYQKAVTEVPPQKAPTLAIAKGRLPCLLAAMTTACGLGSLSVGSVRPVVRFGFFATVGVLLVAVGLLTLWPAITQLVAHRLPIRGTETRSLWWKRVHQFTGQRWKLILAATAAAAPILLFGLNQLETSLSLRSLLPATSPLLQSYEWFDAHIGPMVPVEVVLKFPAMEQGDDPSSELQAAKVMMARAQVVESVRDHVAQLDQCGGTLAASTFAPELSHARGARQVAIRRLTANRLYQHRGELERLGMVRTYEGVELWRVSARMPAGSSRGYGVFLQDLARTIDATLAELGGDHPQSLVCGAIPLVYMAQEQLLNDLIRSFVLAFILIAGVMALLLRSVSGGLLSMIPNVFPALVVFGWMGLRRTPIDIGTMMTASVAIGIAVDDTLHFLVWFRRGLEESNDRRAAVEYAFRHCATAMLQTSIICGLGTLPFVFSEFQPVARFASVLAGLLFAALLGDLLLLPALLLSPLGKYIIKPTRTPHPSRPRSVQVNTT